MDVHWIYMYVCSDNRVCVMKMMDSRPYDLHVRQIDNKVSIIRKIDIHRIHMYVRADNKVGIISKIDIHGIYMYVRADNKVCISRMIGIHRI